jgi:hypothetical protein
MGKIVVLKIRSATILETMVAMIITLFFFSVVTFLFVQVSASGTTEKKVEAHELLNAYLTETCEKRLFYDEKKTIDQFLLERKCSRPEGIYGSVMMNFDIYDHNNQLLDHLNQIAQDEK